MKIHEIFTIHIKRHKSVVYFLNPFKKKTKWKKKDFLEVTFLLTNDE